MFYYSCVILLNENGVDDGYQYASGIESFCIDCYKSCVVNTCRFECRIVFLDSYKISISLDSRSDSKKSETSLSRVFFICASS